MWLYFLGIAKTSYGISILPQEAFFFHCLLLLERFNSCQNQGALFCAQSEERRRYVGLLLRRPGRPVFLLSIAQSSLCRPQISRYLCRSKNPVWSPVGSDESVRPERLAG